MKDDIPLKGQWHFGSRVTLEHVRLGWTVGVEWLLGNLFLGFGKYIIVFHEPRINPYGHGGMLHKVCGPECPED
jgi:hypothetical protein